MTNHCKERYDLVDEDDKDDHVQAEAEGVAGVLAVA